MTGLELFKIMEKMGLHPDSSPTPEKTETVKKLTVCGLPLVEDTATIYFENDEWVVISGENVFLCDEGYIADLLKDETVKKHVYDYKNLYKKFKATNNVTFDALLAAYICNPSASSYDIDRLCGEYGAVMPIFENEADEIIKKAALFDSCCEKLLEELNRSGQTDLFKNIEMPLAKVLGDMEMVGFSVDVDGLKAMSEELGDRIKVIENEIYDAVGYEFNLNSPKQLGVALFEELGLPARKKTKSGYSTNAEVLEELKHLHPAVSLLLEYRTLAKLKSTYTDGLQECVADDGKIHTTFNQTETRTGRISSLEPNLQNIPVRTNEGKRLREFFIAGDGKVLVDADYSQIELRVLASMSGDENMINAFNSGVDIHTATAAQVFGLPIDMVTPVLRSRAKAVNFGIVYGIGAFSLAKDIGVTRKEADDYIKSYLATYPKVATYMESTINDAKQNGYVTTLFGRKRYLPELQNSNGMIRAFGERVARNAPIQGTAADVIKLAMVKVFNRLEKEVPTAKLILQVHDELIVECLENDAELVCGILKEEMENAAQMAVTLTADAAFGKTWLGSKI